MYDVTDLESLADALVHAADSDLLIDALFGTGLNRAPSGLYAEAIRMMNDLSLPIVAVDLPSGANASSAEPFDPCVHAAVTVTFAAPKLCHVFEPAALADDEGVWRVLVAAMEIQLVVDASGLNAFASRGGEINPHRRPRVITPHPGEMARLLARETSAVNANRVEVAREAARVCNCIVVLKGH